ncbi:MAG: hypothetical protein EZS28_037379, partial [Streblomastix strix]
MNQNIQYKWLNETDGGYIILAAARYCDPSLHLRSLAVHLLDYNLKQNVSLEAKREIACYNIFDNIARLLHDTQKENAFNSNNINPNQNIDNEENKQEKKENEQNERKQTNGKILNQFTYDQNELRMRSAIPGSRQNISYQQQSNSSFNSQQHFTFPQQFTSETVCRIIGDILHRDVRIIDNGLPNTLIGPLFRTINQQGEYNTINNKDPSNDKDTSIIQNKNLITRAHSFAVRKLSFFATEEQNRILHDLGALPSLLRLLDHPEVQVSEDAAQAIHNIIIYESRRTDERNEHPYRQEMDEQGGINQLWRHCQCILIYGVDIHKSLFVCTRAAISLGYLFRAAPVQQSHQLTQQPSQSKSNSDIAGIVSVLKLLTQSKEELVADNAMVALRLMALKSENHQLIMDDQFLKRLVDLLTVGTQAAIANSICILSNMIISSSTTSTA